MLNFSNAIVYDIETFPNCFTFCMEPLNSEQNVVWEISQYRDDRKQLLDFFKWCALYQIPMIGFNNIGFDYPVIHLLWKNPSVSYQELYQKANDIIGNQNTNRFGNIIWASDRFAPQIDLFKMHHFDNKAKSTSLKQLQITMRSDFVQDMPIENGTTLTKEQVNDYLVPYNRHDVTETKKFAIHSKAAIDFRAEMEDQFGIEVYNWNDTKIGEKIIEQKLGDDICYDTSTGRKKPRQTPRSKIPLKEVIFPYICLSNPNFKRIYDFMIAQVLTSADVENIGQETTIKTKGVFTDLTTTVNDVVYHYGVGGIHGSVEKKRIQATEEWLIRDIDVSSLYPSIAIANKLYPEHLGRAFVDVYSQIPTERRAIQKQFGKKCPKANALKLACNGVYGKSNSIFSVFYDPKFTMSITINGQLMLSMLLEKLLEVPTISIIQANTDGITYYIHKNYEPFCVKICEEWQKLTGLILEGADYDRMYIRDVNNYIAIGTDGKRKLKGAYWTPTEGSLDDYLRSIAESQPPAWHKNFSNIVSTRAAVANMIDGIDIETYIYSCPNPFDFMLSVKATGNSKLFWGQIPVQKNTRFYISTNGDYLIKLMPPAGKQGAYKKRNGVSEADYNRVMAETNGEWDERVCSKNKSKYETRESSIAAGFKVTVCNRIEEFNWNNVNYDYYIQEAKKLII